MTVRNASTLVRKLLLGVSIVYTVRPEVCVVSAAGGVSTSPLEDSGNANPDHQFRFDVDKYVFNLSLEGYAQGTYAVVFTAGADPTPHSVQFQVK